MDLLCMDNAMAHLSARLEDVLIDKLNLAVHLGPSGIPEDRPYVERCFRSLTNAGMQRLPSTTGSGPRDPRRRDAEAQALRNGITDQHAQELVSIVVGQYNATVHSSLGCSPLDYLRSYYASHVDLVRTVPSARRPAWTLCEIRKQVQVQGGGNSGKRPYIQYLKAHYRSDHLTAQAHLLANKKLRLVINPRNLLTVEAYLPKEGAWFGELKATGRWGLSAHSLQDRRLFNRLERAGQLTCGQREDAVTVLTRYLRHQGGRGAASQAARIARELAKLGVQQDHGLEDSGPTSLLNPQIPLSRTLRR